MLKNLLICAIGILFLSACNQKYPAEVQGYAPIYISLADKYKIEAVNATAYSNPGKIYTYNNYTFQLDRGKGVHVINSADPSNPSKIKFIKVPGCTEISIKNNMLYTNNFEDLVTLNISDIENVTASARSKGVFPMSFENKPPVTNTYFECVDESKGIVIGWSQVTLTNPKCFIP